MTDQSTPQPPYDGIAIPEQYRSVPFEQLPLGVAKHIQVLWTQADPAS